MIKILVVEDEQNIRDEVIEWLQFEGYEAVGAANGRIALELIQQSAPDLVISDIAMPEMDGYQLLLELRSNSELMHIPFIFLTASAEHASMRRGMELGADDYLTKPFTHAEILSAVNARIERKTTHEMQLLVQVEMLARALNEEHEKRQLKSRLVAMFSHDFRNPLASILSSAGMLKTYADRLTPERQHIHLDRIEGAVHLLIQMLDEMLLVAEVESKQLQFSPIDFDLHGLLETIVDEFRSIDQGAHVINYENSVTHTVYVDIKLIRHIVANLISNALKYSPTGRPIAVRAYPLAHGFAIQVLDEGIGIPPESMPRLFEPFHRADNARHTKGTGIGLSTVKECVERHNGRIHVQSELGKGSTFTVEFSAAQEAVTP